MILTLINGHKVQENKFKGKKIRRPSGRVAYQKNLVLEIE